MLLMMLPISGVGLASSICFETIKHEYKAIVAVITKSLHDDVINWENSIHSSFWRRLGDNDVM